MGKICKFKKSISLKKYILPSIQEFTSENGHKYDVNMLGKKGLRTRRSVFRDAE